MPENNYSEITPEIRELSNLCCTRGRIDPELYTKCDVKRGLRDINGKGVLTGLTNISEIRSNQVVDGETVPCDGQLFYRGINVEDIIRGFMAEDRFGFEEVVYLLLFSELPDEQQLRDFRNLLASYRTLPTNFVRDVVMKAPSADMMNTLARSVLTLQAYDSNANDISIDNVLRQCVQLISVFPLLSVYGYQAHRHYNQNESLFIHLPDPELSTAENILRLLRTDSQYTRLEAKVLDLALVLHAEHGGGNNSTFVTRVLTSSGTDTYSAISAAIGALKGPRHGGANIKVNQMLDYIKEGVKDWADEDEVRAFLLRLVNREAGDRSGLIYGMGHAVYTLSDPRAQVLKKYAVKLAEKKGFGDEFRLLELVEKLAPGVFAEVKHSDKSICANVDLYSGLVYRSLGITPELFTPLFAVARVTGWCAHRIEELVSGGRIIRPAYKSISPEQPYIPLLERA